MAIRKRSILEIIGNLSEKEKEKVIIFILKCHIPWTSEIVKQGHTCPSPVLISGCIACASVCFESFSQLKALYTASLIHPYDTVFIFIICMWARMPPIHAEEQPGEDQQLIQGKILDHILVYH